MKKIREWWAERKCEASRRRKDELCLQFDVAEIDGSLYLTHNGVAFKMIDCDTNAREIAEMLESARAAATEYEGL